MPSDEPKDDKNILQKIADSPRTTNILLSILNTMLLLGVFFLGMNATIWTNAQIQEWCYEYQQVQCFGNQTMPGFGDSSNFTIDIE